MTNETERLEPPEDKFVLDEDKARTWLKRLQDQVTESEAYDILIADDWEPRWMESDDTTVYRLVSEAQEAGVIVSEANYELNYVFADDSDGGMYFFTVDIWDGSLRLASQYQELRRLGDPETKGIDAAVSILNEAVSFANEMLRNLAKYVTEHS